MSRKLTPLLQIDNFFNGLRFEKPPAGGVSSQECLADEIAEIESKPCLGRHRETFLGSMKDRRWYLCSHDLAQNPFALVVAYFHVVLQARQPFHEFVIEKRHPKLNGRRHGHFVGLQQKVFGQPHLRVHIEHSIQWRGSSDRTEVCSKHFVQAAIGFLNPITPCQRDSCFWRNALNQTPIVVLNPSSRTP